MNEKEDKNFEKNADSLRRGDDTDLYKDIQIVFTCTADAVSYNYTADLKL